MEIKKKIEELVERIKSDKELQSQFTKEPIATVEKLLGIDLPQEQLKQLVDGVKAKLSLDQAGQLLGGLFGRK